MLQLSYSSADKCMSCQQKYVYAKILHLPADPDSSEDTLAFRFGKAHHSIHEWCEHELGYWEDKQMEYLSKACEEQALDNESACLLHSTVTSSLMLWKQIGLRVIKCEIRIGDETFVGYVDFVAINPDNREWYIGDLKTTSMAKNIGARLLRDPQLSLYFSWIGQIAEMLGLDAKLFRGCLYRETVKPKIVVKQNEKPESFTRRCLAESQTFFVPVDKMALDQTAVHAKVYDTIIRLHNGEMPIRNYKACMDWNRRCEYWSRCYGMLGSDTENFMAERTVFLKREKSGFNFGGNFDVITQPISYETKETTETFDLNGDWL